MLRILADENFPGQAVQALRDRGFDVVWVRTVAPGISDTFTDNLETCIIQFVWKFW